MSAAIGIVWGIRQLLALVMQGQQLDLAPPTLAFGIAAGAMVTLSNLLLLESLTHLDASLGSAIYRLNTVGVVILSFIFLGEPMHPVKLLGIGSSVRCLMVPQPASRSSGYYWRSGVARRIGCSFTGVPRPCGILPAWLMT